MHGRTWTLLLILLAARASWAGPASAPPPHYRPPQTQGLCPALAEDYELCSYDLQSGNCADFVGAAARLGEIYRSELRAHPSWISELKTTIWWGCGEAHLDELRALLERIGSQQAHAVLVQEPYRSLGAPRAPAPEPDSPQ